MAFCIECGESYKQARRDLGYRTCLDCGSPVFRPPVIPVSKSNYIVGSMFELTQSYNVKGHR
jgi:DNA-directed RNA polymerase subunit RPC12/RpoP